MIDPAHGSLRGLCAGMTAVEVLLVALPLLGLAANAACAVARTARVRAVLARGSSPRSSVRQVAFESG